MKRWLFNAWIIAMVWAGPWLPALASARDDYIHFFKDLHGLEGSFSQQLIDDKGHVKAQSRGELALLFPNQFYWKEVEPHAQQIVADGRKIWIYDVDLNQVTVREQTSNTSDSALLVLMKPAKLDEWFRVEELAAAEEGLHWLVMQPKQGHEASFTLVRLGLDRHGIVRMDVTDALGQETRIRFAAWRRNPHFDPAHFRFIPPPSADVIGP